MLNDCNNNFILLKSNLLDDIDDIIKFNKENKNKIFRNIFLFLNFYLDTDIDIDSFFPDKSNIDYNKLSVNCYDCNKSVSMISAPQEINNNDLKINKTFPIEYIYDESKVIHFVENINDEIIKDIRDLNISDIQNNIDIQEKILSALKNIENTIINNNNNKEDDNNLYNINNINFNTNHNNIVSIFFNSPVIDKLIFPFLYDFQMISFNNNSNNNNSSDNNNNNTSNNNSRYFVIGLSLLEIMYTYKFFGNSLEKIFNYLFFKEKINNNIIEIINTYHSINNSHLINNSIINNNMNNKINFLFFLVVVKQNFLSDLNIKYIVDNEIYHYYIIRDDYIKNKILDLFNNKNFVLKSQDIFIKLVNNNFDYYILNYMYILYIYWVYWTYSGFLKVKSNEIIKTNNISIDNFIKKINRYLKENYNKFLEIINNSNSNNCKELFKYIYDEEIEENKYIKNNENENSQNRVYIKFPFIFFTAFYYNVEILKYYFKIFPDKLYIKDCYNNNILHILCEIIIQKSKTYLNSIGYQYNLLNDLSCFSIYCKNILEIETNINNAMNNNNKRMILRININKKTPICLILDYIKQKIVDELTNIKNNYLKESLTKENKKNENINFINANSCKKYDNKDDENKNEKDEYNQFLHFNSNFREINNINNIIQYIEKLDNFSFFIYIEDYFYNNLYDDAINNNIDIFKCTINKIIKAFLSSDYFNNNEDIGNDNNVINNNINCIKIIIRYLKILINIFDINSNNYLPSNVFKH